MNARIVPVSVAPRYAITVRGRVVLASGETLTLGDTHDVGANNSGALVFEDREPIHIAWRNIDRIEFNR